MINTNNVDHISNLLSTIFYVCLTRKYHPTTVEEIIISSQYFDQLEKGDDSFLNSYVLDELVENIFHCKINLDELVKTNSLCLWLGDLYTDIFFKFNKSFTYIFLYLPVIKAINMFPLYHEMDFSQSMDRFIELSKENTILRLLLKKRNMSAKQLSALSLINYNTIISYMRNNEYVYNAKFDHIYKISEILGVKINVFSRTINNYRDTEMYDFDKQNIKYRSWVGLLLASYYCDDLKSSYYKYDDENKVFYSSVDIIKTLWTTINSFPNDTYGVNGEIEECINVYSHSVSDEQRRNTIVVVFEYNQVSLNPKAYSYLNDKYGFKKIIIINHQSILCISDKCWIKEISYSVNNIVINNAKRLTSDSIDV